MHPVALPAANAIARRFPRTTSALVFGSVTALMTSAMWTGGAAGRLVLSAGAGAAFAAAGALMGERLVDSGRARTPAQAARAGLVTALIATVVFAMALSAKIESENTLAHGAGAVRTIVQGFPQLVTETALFAFLGGGWALALLSAGVAWGIHRLGVDPRRGDGPSG